MGFDKQLQKTSCDYELGPLPAAHSTPHREAATKLESRSRLTSQLCREQTRLQLETYMPTMLWSQRGRLPFSKVWVELSALRLLPGRESDMVMLAQPIPAKLRWVGKCAPLPHTSPAFPEPFPTPAASKRQFSRHSCGKTKERTRKPVPQQDQSPSGTKDSQTHLLLYPVRSQGMNSNPTDPYWHLSGCDHWKLALLKL